MRHLALALLGSLRIERDHKPLAHFGSDKALALLLLLVVESERVWRRQELVGIFWSEQPETVARHNLSQTLLRLRRALGDSKHTPEPFLLLTPQTLRFNPAAHWESDAAAFDRLLAATRAHPHDALDTCPTCEARLVKACDLYRGDFAQGFSLPDSPGFEEWLLVQREARRQELLDALDALTLYYEKAGRYLRVLRYAERAVALEPWREHAHRQILRAHAALGEEQAALAHYDRMRQKLAEELGLEPESRTRALVQQILDAAQGSRTDDTLLTFTAPSNPTPSLLPAALTPFVGRTRELHDLGEMLDTRTCRLLTLTGLGGIGKTRLALEIAQARTGLYPDGVFFVSLAPLSHPDQMVPAIGEALGLTWRNENPVQGLLRAVRDKRLLLVLDNLEHLIEGAFLVSDLLRAAPRVQALVTSREALAISGEQTYPVQGLDQSDSEGDRTSSAVRLFVSCARRIGADWVMTPEVLPAVARICALVEGMPLAIELAAAWLETLTPQEIADEIARNLAFLAHARRGVPERHQSIRALFDGVWNNLDESERRVLGLLSTFRGGFTRQAAEAITGATLQDLAHLTGKALIRPMRNIETGRRYDMHELVRQYAEQRLGELADYNRVEIETRFSEYYLNWLAEWEAALFGPAPRSCLAAIRREEENLRRAWEWAVALRRTDLLARAANAFRRFCEIAGSLALGVESFSCAIRDLPVRLPESDVVALEQDARLVAQLLVARALFLRLVGQQTAALADAQDALHRAQTLGDKALQAQSLFAVSLVAVTGGRFAEARPGFDRALELAREVRDRRLEALCLRYLVFPTVPSSENIERALGIARLLQDRWLENRILDGVGAAAFYRSDLWNAYRSWLQALEFSRTLNDRYEVSRMENNLGDVCRHLGAYQEAHDFQTHALASFRTLADPVMCTNTLEGLSRLYCIQGKVSDALAAVEQGLTLAYETPPNHTLAYFENTRGTLYAARGEAAAAREAFLRAVHYGGKAGHAQIAMESYAGLAEISLAGDDTNTAREWVERILNFLDAGNDLDGYTNILQIYLTLYHTLAACGENRADSFLTLAHAQVQTVANSIDDTAAHTRYLDSVDVQRVLAEWNARADRFPKHPSAPTALRPIA